MTPVSITDEQRVLISEHDHYTNSRDNAYFIPFVWVDTHLTDINGFQIMKMVKIPESAQLEINDFMRNLLKNAS